MPNEKYARLFQRLGQTREEIVRLQHEESVDAELLILMAALTEELTATGNRIAKLRPELVGQEQIEEVVQ